MTKAHLLIADITGSTPLYEQLSDREAFAQISFILDRMRALIDENGGHCVKSKGDDTLSFFSEADQAFHAARMMIETEWNYGLSIHAGIHCGELVRQDENIYGDAVNTTARLASLAKPREVLICDAVFEKLPDATRSLFVSMGGIKLKGKKEPTRVHSFAVGGLVPQTVFLGASNSTVGRCTESAELVYGDASWTLTDGQSITIGRAVDCQVVLNQPWVSRKHGVFELRAAQLEYTDHSSTGSTIVMSDGKEIAVQRRTMLLNGDGQVLIGTHDQDHSGSFIRYSTLDPEPD